VVITRHGWDTWQFWVFVIAPDVALVYGTAGGLEKGQLHPRAVGLYNLLHMPLWPLLMAGAVLVLAGTRVIGTARPWYLGALAWELHIAADWALGFGPRDPRGFQRYT
jgi:hypothetical protein